MNLQIKGPAPAFVEVRPARKPPSALKKLVRCLKGEKNPLVEDIKKLASAQELGKDNPQKVFKVLQAVNDPCLKKELRRIVAHMSDKERKNLLKKALETDFTHDQKFLGNQCVNLMTVEQLRSLARFISEDFKDVHTAALEYNKTIQEIKKYQGDDVRIKMIKESKSFILLRFINNIVRTLAVAFNLLDLNKEPNTYFETKYMLDIYWRLLEIPLKIFKFIFCVIVNPLISIPVIVGGTLVSAVALHVFNRWFKKCPSQLPYCTNLTEEVKKGTVQQIFGREKEISEILERLAANTEASRKHPLLIGKSGVGKTELIKGLAWRLAKGEVPEILKGKKLFYVNSAELMKNAVGFNLKDPLEQIKDKVDGHQKEIILVFDEAHNLIDTLGQRFHTILDTSANSLFYALGVTTPEKYKEKIENTHLDRRFKTLPIQEASEEQTRTILRNLNHRQAPDIKVSKKTLNAIFAETNEKIPKRSQPDKSIFVLSQALEKVRHLQEGGAFDQKMHQLVAKKEDLASKLSRKKLHNVSIASPNIRSIQRELDEVNAKIDQTLKQITEKKHLTKQYIQLKKLRQWHEAWLYSMSEKILKDANLGKKATKMLEKIYLFNSFVLIPQMDQYLSKFVKQHQLEVAVDQSMVKDIVNNWNNDENLVKQA